MKPNRRLTLNQIQIVAWGTSALCALVVSVGVIFGISYAQYSSKTENEFRQFQEKSSSVFRRIEAELAVNNGQAVPALARMFEKDLGINSIEIADTWPAACLNFFNCTFRNSEGPTAAKKIETRYGNYVLVSRQKLSTFDENFRVGNLWWIVLALGSLSFLGVIIQRVLTRKYIANPISRLVNKALSKEEIPSYYPVEIAQLARELSDSFEARDKVVFGQLASGVIHDLRTQLFSIETAMKLVSESPNDDVSRFKRFELLRQATDRNIPKMKAIIETTLDGARDLQIFKNDTNLDLTLSEAIHANSALATARGIQLEAEIASHIKVSHDSVQLERVFSNLIKNAIEAFDNESSQAERVVRLKVKTEPKDICISVEDSGPGLAVSEKDLFRFSKTTKPHGSGLGLLISRKIVSAHGGEISAGRAEGLGGAKFEVRLPVPQGVDL